MNKIISILIIFGFILEFQISQAQSGLNTCDVKKSGAIGDGKTKDTKALQAAIDTCAKTGGKVVLHDGTFLSGMLVLKSHIDFYIDHTATLKGTQDDGDYPELHPNSDNSQLDNCRKALLYAEKASDLTIEGHGTIDGNGNKPEWIGPNTKSPERTRPMAIFIVQSNQILIQDLSVKDAAMWGVVNFESDNITIRGLNIHTPFFGNRDGMDIVDCHHVLIENNQIFSEDDSICLKTGSSRGTEDVLVRNNSVLQSTVANGLKLGTASTGSFKDITFTDNTVQNVDKAAMTVESIDGAAVENVSFQNIKINNVGTPFFVLLGQRKPNSKDGNAVPAPVGSIQGIHFENISGNSNKHAWGSALSGTIVDGVRYALRDISFKNINVTYGGDSTLTRQPLRPPEYLGQYPDPNIWGNLPASGLFLRHVDGLRLENVNLKVNQKDLRPVIFQEDAH